MKRCFCYDFPLTLFSWIPVNWFVLPESKQVLNTIFSASEIPRGAEPLWERSYFSGQTHYETFHPPKSQERGEFIWPGLSFVNKKLKRINQLNLPWKYRAILSTSVCTRNERVYFFAASLSGVQAHCLWINTPTVVARQRHLLFPSAVFCSSDHWQLIKNVIMIAICFSEVPCIPV